MPRAPIVSVFAIAIAAFASAGWSQGKPPSATQEKGGWVPPGTPGSPIDGTIFHAQVLLDAAGFPGGTIDGKKGMSFQKAIEGFQEARGLDINGDLDGPTRAALLSDSRARWRSSAPCSRESARPASASTFTSMSISVL